MVNICATSIELSVSFLPDTIYVDTTLADTTAIVDTTIKEQKRQPLLTINKSRMISDGESETLLTSQDFKGFDYRNASNILSWLPYSFLQDLGSNGQPNELILYGLGFQNISYMKNGILLNNRWQNAFDLHHFQSESIDTIEYFSLTRGFLYSLTNNPISVNFFTKNKSYKKPYTRIRFYQAQDEEGYLDVLFDTKVSRPINVTLEITNSSIDPRGNRSDYNTDYGVWKVSTNVRYLVNNKLTMIGSYNHIRSEIQLNGGVQQNSLMYSPQEANIIYTERDKRTTGHRFTLNLLGDFIDDNSTDLSFYYQYNKSEFNQNKNLTQNNIPRIKNNNLFKVIGALLLQKFELSGLNFDISGNFENIIYNTEVLTNNPQETFAAISGKASFKNHSLFKPTIYGKFLSYDNSIYPGIGGDIFINPNDIFKLFIGGSFFEKPFSILERQFVKEEQEVRKSKIFNFEAAIESKLKHISSKASYFFHKNDNAAVGVIDLYNDTLLINEVGFYELEKLERQGINLKLSIKYWKLLLSGNLTYYINNENNKSSSLPDLTALGGLYYVDTLFNKNLKLKAGINLKYISSKQFNTYDFEKSVSSVYSFNRINSSIGFINDERIPSNYTIDLFIAGTIQDLAVVYFVFENLLDNQYYIVPYYPMNSQGIKIGLSWELFE
ncbi:putative porin [Bacteroidota bacterium]